MDSAQNDTPTPVAAPLPAPVMPPDRGVLPEMSFSVVLHLGLLLASALSFPTLATTPDADPSQLQFMIQTYLAAAAERAPEAPTPETVIADDADGEPIAYSRCGEERGGSMGDPSVADTGHRYGVQGPPDNPDPHLARDSAWGVQSFVFMLNVHVHGHQGGDPEAPRAAWGRDDSLGNDPRSARAGMWGDEIAMTAGSPGLGQGLLKICEACGASGKGRRFDRTAAAGATGTEEAPHGSWGLPAPAR